jgi:hypothetical protein
MSAEIRSSGLFVLGAWRFTFDSEGILDQAPNCFGGSRPQPHPWATAVLVDEFDASSFSIKSYAGGC